MRSLLLLAGFLVACSPSHSLTLLETLCDGGTPGGWLVTAPGVARLLFVPDSDHRWVSFQEPE